MTRSIFSKVFFTCFYSCVACVALTTGQANASLIGDTVEVGFPSEGETDTVTVNSGFEIVPDDGSYLGSVYLALDEYVDIGESSISLHVLSGGTDPDEPNAIVIDGREYLPSGYLQGDQLTFSDLDFSGIPDAVLTGVTISLLNIVNLELGTDVFFTADSVTLNLDRFLIEFTNSGVPDYGTITLNLQFDTATPVPLPGSLILLMSGLAFLSCSMISKRKIARAV